MKIQIAGSWGWVKRHRITCLITLAAAASLAGAAMAVANQACHATARSRMFYSLATVPGNDVGLVLGTAPSTRHGQPNLHFTSRMDAAAALYHAGKVQHLLVSGDNHVATYDEPTAMMNALIARGVPAAAITRDYAGFHTLDSVVRAQTVFGLQHFTIISETYHCPRALWIARSHGLDAVAFAAPDVALRSWAWRAEAREELARAWCAVDLLVHRQPHFTGPKEPILLTSNDRP